MKKRRDYVRITLYLPEKEYEKIAKEAAKKTVSMAALLRQKLGIGG